ncbi:hypothetical protein JOD55_001322 [Arcanobacterium pluranimalium]|uniref:DUF3710 domain-containing protein n=1 Tax=Arcanobacterium pluranimalium TaxID=108028 RepID=UPI0019566814|nr:DUF3710 domain-containing protein [Arcanobacterium pluranimalium]MBM7825495.1 hypothetical protein [Arcanobacterium pluranimalium]
MGLFSRAKNTEDVEVNAQVEEVTSTDAPESTHAPESHRNSGPFDISEYGGVDDLIDAGALKIPAVSGATLQFTTDPTQEHVLGVVYMKDDSVLQLQVFAAPKTRGLWDEIRLDMRTSIAAQGGSSQEIDSPLGKGLLAQMPVANSKEFAPHLFLGVDGPRWFMRVTLYGRAGFDSNAAVQMLSILEDVVVERGAEPHPPRELLTLKIPHLDRHGE